MSFDHTPNSSTETRGFKPGWTLYKPEKLTDGRIKLDLQLRTPHGKSNAYFFTLAPSVAKATHKATLIEPGTQTSGGGLTVAVTLKFKSPTEVEVKANGQTWLLKREDGKSHYFAYLDRLPERGEALDFDELLAGEEF